MAQVITNQASLRFNYGTTEASVVSNVATAVLTQALTASKTSLSTEYRVGDTATFVVSLNYAGTTALNNVRVTDDLGTYTLGTVSVTPYTYEPTALLFINGTAGGTLTPTVTNSGVTFTIPSLPASSRAQIIYQAVVNDTAPLTTESTITNTVTVTADGITEAVTASYTLTAEAYADVAVTKTMSPATIVDGGQIVYTFYVTNRGNTAATEIVLRDAFEPAPTGITVTVGETTLPTTDYTYTNGVLTVSTVNGNAITLPAASFTQEAATGVVTVTPSSLVITVTGTI